MDFERRIYTLIADSALSHTIGGRIRSLRDERNVSQLDLAAALKISTSALRNIEHGDAMPRLSTLEFLSDFFGLPIDYIVRGVMPGADGSNLDTFRETGLNDTSIAFLGEQIDLGKYSGGLSEYITTLNSLVSGGLLPLVWTLNRLNSELADIDSEIKKTVDEAPKSEDIVAEMQLSNKLEPLQERRDLLRLRYLRQVEQVFDQLIVKGDD
jgi:transcriptional regulator with XRE-family HTH domain